MKHPNRETWLLAATENLRSGLFKEQGAVIPDVRVSIGFPGGGSARKRIGEYWLSCSCTDSVPQIFISPVLDSPIRALDTLVHELVHAVHPESGHKGPFRKLALAVGLTGKMKSTVAGPELTERLNALISELGPFPHSSINLADRKKQTTRLNKAECPTCGYTCRVTKKWLDSVGPPICPGDMCLMEVPA
jgi:hypothetical protein